MAKDTRITVRMSEELGAWVHEQAMLGEQDDAAFVRMVLSNLRRGVTAAPVAAVVAPAPQPVRRDVLEVASGNYGRGPAMTAINGGAFEHDVDTTMDLIAGEEAGAEAVDLDDLINSTLAQADAEGLTQAHEQEPLIPSSGVRAVMRPAVPFSRQPGHIPA